MKKRWIAIAMLAVLLMGIGGAIGKVGVRQESGGSAYSLYFVERDLRSADGGDALRSEERTLEDGGLSTEELAAALVAELLKGPADPTLKSPFPKGTALLSAEQKGTELRVDLSAAYSTLSGVGLSLADYAITLTLTQLPDVARVRITVAGRELDYRSRQVFLARDILAVPKEDVAFCYIKSLFVRLLGSELVFFTANHSLDIRSMHKNYEQCYNGSCNGRNNRRTFGIPKVIYKVSRYR